MEGVPAADLAAWKKRQAEESGVPNPDEQRPKKPRFAQVALTPADAKAQLAAHRALMGLVPAAVAPVAAPSPFGVPPPVQNGFPVAPTPIPGMPGLAFLSFFLSASRGADSYCSLQSTSSSSRFHSSSRSCVPSSWFPNASWVRFSFASIRIWS